MLPAWRILPEIHRSYQSRAYVEWMKTMLGSMPTMMDILKEWDIDLDQETPERMSKVVPAGKKSRDKPPF